MSNVRRILVATALLLIGGATVATPAQAEDGCIDGLDGVPVCTPHIGPPPPPDYLRPAPLPAPRLDNSPREAPPYQAPAPVHVAPVPAAPVAPAPVYVAPVPVRQQPAVPAYGAPAAPATAIVEAPAAPVGAQGEPDAAATPAAAEMPSAPMVVAPIKHSTLKPVMDIENSGIIVAASETKSDAVVSTPVVLFVALVVAGTLAMVIILRFGPGIAGIRGTARGLLRR